MRDTERRTSPLSNDPGGEAVFAELAERHRRELQVHCYRMTGSLESSEDLVQETLLRAWRARGSFEGRASARAWLYRIATNACLDRIKAEQRRVRAAPAGAPAGTPAEVPWLQPYPDELLEPAAARHEEPEAVVIARETVELAFLTLIQQLPARQRAALILRDVLGWSAKETAALLDTTPTSANSLLQRARETVAARDASELRKPEATTARQERAALDGFVRAFEQADADGLASLLHADVRSTMPPAPMVFAGLEAFLGPIRDGVLVPEFGRFRVLPIRANTQPAAALYLRPPGEDAFRPFALDVLRVEGDRIVEVVGFSCPPHGPVFTEDARPDLFSRFGLPEELFV